MSTKVRNKAVQIPTFCGKSSNYIMRMRRFKAYAKVKKLSNALAKDFYVKFLPVDLNLLSSNGDIKATKFDWIEKNILEVDNLTLSFQTPSLMEGIESSTTKEYPNGIASKVMEELADTYRPNDWLSPIKDKTALKNILFSKGRSPTRLFWKNDCLILKYCKVKTFEKLQLIAHMFLVTPAKYTTMIPAKISALGDAFDLKELEKNLQIH